MTLFQRRLAPQRRSAASAPQTSSGYCQSTDRGLEISIGSGGTPFSDFPHLSDTNGNYGAVAWVYRRSAHPAAAAANRSRACAWQTQHHWCPNCPD